MAKAKSKRKAKEKDFKKVKLKLGRKIQKGKDVETSFKSRPIIVKDQLKETSTHDGSLKKHNILEVLSHVQHYNAGKRHEALMNLRECLRSQPTLLHVSLENILSKVAQLFCDKDRIVRRASITLFKNVAMQLSPTNVSPFFTLLGAHVGCAMTHIDEGIQLDSLSIIDVLINNFPRLMTVASTSLLTNFVDLISQQKSGSKRSLNSTPNSKLSQDNSRVQVFLRMQAVLERMLEHMLEDRSERHEESSTIKLANQFRLNSSSKSVKGRNVPISAMHTWKKFVNDVVPLLGENWVESCQVESLHEHQLTSLTAIVSILNALYKICTQLSVTDSNMEASWFASQHGKQFTQQIKSTFPFAAYSKIKRLGQETDDEPSSLKLNLLTCHLLVSVGSLEEVNDLVVPFLEANFSQTQSFSHTDFEIFLEVALSVTHHASSHPDCNNILDAVCDIFKHSKDTKRLQFLVSFARNFLDYFISEHFMNSSACSLLEFPALSKWLVAIAEQMFTTVKSNSNLTAAMFSLIQTSVQCDFEPGIHDILTKHQCDMITMLSNVSGKQFECLITFASQVEEYSKEFYMSLFAICLESDVSVLNLRRFIGTVQANVEKMKGSPLALAHFISFLFALVIGITEEKLIKLGRSDNVERQQMEWNGFQVLVQSTKPRRRQFQSIAISFIKQTVPIEEVKEFCLNFIDQRLISKFNRFPSYTVLGICQLFKAIRLTAKDLEFLSSSSSRLLDVIMALLLNGDLPQLDCEICLSCLIEINLVSGFLARCQQSLQECNILSDAQAVLEMLTRASLFTNGSLNKMWDRQILHHIRDIVIEKFSNSVLKNCQWWTDFLYHMRL